MAFTMTSLDFFEKNRATNSDISGHVQALYELGKKCDVIVEYGVRGGVSTSAWIHSCPKELWCYDISKPEILPTLQGLAEQNKIYFHFQQADTRMVEHSDCDLLFLDTLHTYGQLKAELKHHFKVRKYIVMHDTETNRYIGENKEEGLQKAIDEFLVENPEWKAEAHYPENNGLTVLARFKSC